MASPRPIVRRPPLMKRLLDKPKDAWDAAAMRVLDVWGDLFQEEAVGYAVGTALCAVQMMAELVEASVWLDVALLVVSVANAWRFMTRVKVYTVLSARYSQPDSELVILSPNARRVRLEQPVPLNGDPEDEDFNYAGGASTPVTPGRLRRLRNMLSPAPATPEAQTRDAWELRVWDPSPFCKAIFTLYSPCVGLLLLLQKFEHSLDWLTALIVVLCFDFFLALLIHFYALLVKDREIVLREVYQVHMENQKPPQLSHWDFSAAKPDRSYTLGTGVDEWSNMVSSPRSPTASVRPLY